MALKLKGSLTAHMGGFGDLSSLSQLLSVLAETCRSLQA